eukprot:CAMPEP_0202910112 /NCGR_PEP_ID=MMETSP1392-20130828/51141_1 /ASSEMBLY_ACC=CAM_ASM_000868 /TAXON_ID=225041 /ORGANISM="Chlamydomonas chlamydogama, Strain SAG 11-48b" /LENGTH=330 /DNA_ID=CAMNT_0049600105 /DNA_START=131 /DNA_END=1123 /DNA_ORIENTATION=-
MQVTTTAMPDFMPSAVADITEPSAQQMARRMRRAPVPVDTLGTTINTAFVGPSPDQAKQYPPDAPAIVLLHSFDSSCLEFRRLVPLLEAVLPTYAVDLVGWGFTDHTPFQSNTSLSIGPEVKREHLRRFITQQLGGRPVVLVGTSLGGAIALDFALNHKELVSKLVLVDAQAFIDGIGRMSQLPRWMAVAGVQLLKTEWLRQQANLVAYRDKERYATKDALRVGRLHTYLPGWLEANVAFMRSGGYSLSKRVKEVGVETLVLWGRNDEILDPKYATRFQEELPNGRLVWVEQCGHSPHLEQPQFMAQQVLEFVGVAAGAEVEKELVRVGQ